MFKVKTLNHFVGWSLIQTFDSRAVD